MFNTPRHHWAGDVPFVGHPSLASGENRGAGREGPRTGRRCMPSATRAAATTAPAKLPPKSEDLVGAADQGPISRSNDTLLWWVAGGHRRYRAVRKSRRDLGLDRRRGPSSPSSTARSKYPGYFRQLFVVADAA